MFWHKPNLHDHALFVNYSCTNAVSVPYLAVGLCSNQHICRSDPKSAEVVYLFVGESLNNFCVHTILHDFLGSRFVSVIITPIVV